MFKRIEVTEQADSAPLRIMRCDCGEKHNLNDQRCDFTCKCRREYNAFGQELAPREQWEESDDHDDPEIFPYRRECPHFDMGTGLTYDDRGDDDGY